MPRMQAWRLVLQVNRYNFIFAFQYLVLFHDLRNHLYHCAGKTEWSNCTYKSKDPERTAFKVPKSYKEDIPFL